jgi:Outer membrane protein beta-barrel domain
LRNRILLLLLFCGLVASASAQSNFSRYNFTAGGGLGIGRDDVASYVGDSGQLVLGAGINYSKMFGFDAEYMYYNLPFRQSVILAQSLPGQSGHMQSISLDTIVHVPFHFHNVGAYGIFGLGFYDREVSLKHPQTLTIGTPCQPAWRWWDLTCVQTNPGSPYTIQPQQIMSSNSVVAGGFNVGGGLTYQMKYLRRANVFLEVRYHRAYQADGETIVMPITLGLRW